jgi:hypothetical protein
MLVFSMLYMSLPLCEMKLGGGIFNRCVDKGQILENLNKSIGVSNYQLTNLLPENYKWSLPTIE